MGQKRGDCDGAICFKFLICQLHLFGVDFDRGYSNDGPVTAPAVASRREWRDTDGNGSLLSTLLLTVNGNWSSVTGQ